MVNSKKALEKLVFLSDSALQTRKIGEVLAREILKTKKQKGAFILALKGDLGGGKTTFIQGLAKGFSISEKILSPTFVILKRFKIKDLRLKSSSFKNFYHIDCYRVGSDKELFDIGMKDLLLNKENIVAIEWPNIIKSKIHYDVLADFEFVDAKTRKISFTFFWHNL